MPLQVCFYFVDSYDDIVHPEKMDMINLIVRESHQEKLFKKEIRKNLLDSWKMPNIEPMQISSWSVDDEYF